ncbi:uncharacterized protein ACLA_091110 [Aspergillus clavatus NRRL 1]|uniref:F-box domain protein n=1 Tax=Aspergillus clavatus (strain ATCC 1007 / CBS 513.65 / DSM 816 / NCTC 3887 / NRRL 1 / QM 1276 / 107) TaxID=344612 RepID=A1CEW4_ASPCL|nr:uncharacterized protein ACLA_091110 [Aspergillus clavatus NRRL 1]EAW11413.1 conserved hypothetical protein [Aspergillus clavatus NRRL 1]
MESIADALQEVKIQDQSLESGAQNVVHDVEESSLKESSIVTPFRFLDLPSEIRLRIYDLYLFTTYRWKSQRSNGSVGASARNPPIAPYRNRIALFLVSWRVHDEATDYFYSMLTFRVFPIQDWCRTPTVRGLSARYRPFVTTIELILGSSWTSPPRDWVVNNRLGLEKMVRVRTLKVFIECDPSHPVFEGFRINKDFYSEFAGKLLQKILERLPNVVQVEFDGYPSVLKGGGLMKRLLHEAKSAQKKILWGTQRGWTDWDGEENKEPKPEYHDEEAECQNSVQ